MLRLAAVVTAILLIVAAAASAKPPTVRTVSLPRTAVVAADWRVSVSIKPRTRGTLEARGPSDAARGARTRPQGRGDRKAPFPRAGSYAVSVKAGGRTTKLGSVSGRCAEEPADPRPAAITAEPSGWPPGRPAPRRALLRSRTASVSKVAEGVGIYNVAVSGGATTSPVARAPIYRVDGSSFTRVSRRSTPTGWPSIRPANLYVTVYPAT